MAQSELIYGRHPVTEALRPGASIEKVYLQRDLRADWAREVESACRAMSVPLARVPIQRLNRLTRGNHQGVVAITAAVSYYLPEDVLPGIFEKGEVPLILVLDGITDVRNLGAIARTALGTGVHALVWGTAESAQVTPAAVKSSAGALRKITLCRSQNLPATVKFFRESGLRILAADSRGNIYPSATDMTVPLALVMGAEDRGVSDALLRLADELVKLPMRPGIESYNVSVAAAMLLYEAMRQRG